MPQSWLTTAQKRDLIRFIVANGQSYTNYQRWADANLIPEDRRYTERSFKAWCDKRRRVIQEVRQEYKVAAAQSSIYDRELRLRELEESVIRINAAIDRLDKEDEKYVDKLVRLEEQKGKHLQRIAQERGEWGKGPAEVNEAANKLAQEMMSVFAEERASKRGLPEGTIDGEYTEVPEPSTD